MGGDAGLWVRRHVRELETRERVVMFTAALSCMDSTGLVPYSMMRLADECGLSLRSTQAAVRTLSRLEFLVQADTGFRLARYIEQTLGGGKICREKPKEKENNTEGIQGIRRDSRDSQGFSLSPQDLKPDKLPARPDSGRTGDEQQKSAGSERQKPDRNMLVRIWAPIAQYIRQQVAPEVYARKYAGARIIEVTGTSVLVAVQQAWLDAVGGETEAALKILSWARAAGVDLVRDRTLKVVSIESVIDGALAEIR